MGLLGHDFGDGEDGHEHGDGDAADEDAHDADHDGFDELGGGFDGGFEVFVHVGRDAVEDVGEFAGFFAGVDHLGDGLGDEGRFDEGFGELGAVLDFVTNVFPHFLVVAVAGDFLDDGEAVEHLHAGGDHGAHGGEGAGEVEFVEHGAEDGDAELRPVIEALSGGGAEEVESAAEDDHRADEPEVPVSEERGGDAHEDLGGERTRGLSAGEDGGEFGEDEGEEEDGHADGHDHHKGGVDEGAFHFFGGFALGDEVFGEFAEHSAHGAGEFRSADERDVVFGEDAGEAFQRGGEILSAVDALDDGFEDAGAGFGEALFGEGGEGFGERDAGVDHDGELHGEVDEFLTFDGGALVDDDGDGGGGGFDRGGDAAGFGGFDIDDVFSLSAKGFGGVTQGECGDEAVDELAALVPGLVGEAIM